jgi:hypothetical protein
MIEFKNWFSSLSDWCSSSSHFLNNTSSYAIVDQSVLLLCGTCFIMLIIGLFLHPIFNEKLTNDNNSNFWFGLLVFSMFVGSSICNQLISSLTCRPIEILYDKRYTSILGVQILSFLICVHFAYSLGCIFTPLFDQSITTLSKSNNRTPSFRAIDCN